MDRVKPLTIAFAFAMLLAVVSPVYADPDVEDYYPEKNADNIPVGVSIWVEFDEQMDENSVKEGFTLRDEDGEDVPGKVTYNKGSCRAVFKPDSPLKYNTRYRVRLSSSIENEDGDNLDGFGFSFYTVQDAVVYVDGVEIVDGTISVNKSPVDIIVYAPGAERVLYNKEELKESGNDYNLKNVLLKTGSNNFSFDVIYEYVDDNWETKEGKFTVKRTVNFVNAPEEGATVTHDLNQSNKVSVFDKQMTINFPKGYYVREKDGAASSQLIALKLEKIVNVDGSPAVSYLFNIVHAPWQGDEYVFDRFRDYDAGVTAPPGGEMIIPLENLSEAAFRTVTVMYDSCDGVSGIWENIGGQADAAKKTITVPFKGFGRYVAVNRLWNFNDGDGPARPYVELLWAKGIMSAALTAPPGDFGLRDQNGREVYITRGEFTTMLGKALKLELAENQVGAGTFSDILYMGGFSYGYSKDGSMVPLTRDAALYIEAAAKNGFINGRRDQDGRFIFGYFDMLTREQAAISIMSAAGFSVNWLNDRAIRMQLERNFKDARSISATAGPYVLAAVQNGYFQLNEDRAFGPNQRITRAEAAVLIYRLMESKKLL